MEGALLGKFFIISERSGQFQSHRGSLRHSKLCKYKTFRSQLKLEKDLLVNMNFKYHETLCKFRSCDHTLLIETGGHKGLHVNDRLL